MPFFFHADDNPTRHPSEMSVMVNTMAIGEDDAFRTAFLVSHLSDEQTSGPSVICSLWVDIAHENEDEDGDPILTYVLTGEEEAESSMEWTMVFTPQQARAHAYAMLRLADGLDAMIENGEYGARAVPDIPVYRSEPQL
jgi:hypothetical protein